MTTIPRISPTHRFGENPDAGRFDAVVVCDQNLHGLCPYFEVEWVKTVLLRETLVKTPTPSLVEECDHTGVAIHTDHLPVLDPLGGNPETEHRWNAIFPCDDRPVGEDTAQIGD